MRGLGVIALLALGAVVFLYVRQTGGAPAVNGGLDPNRVTGPAKDAAAAFYAQPWFWTFAVSGAAAVLGIMTWRRIGGWGRAAVLVFATIAATVMVVKLG